MPRKPTNNPSASAFIAFKNSSDFRRRHLPFLKTLEDQDLMREIGIAQTIGRPITIAKLLSREIASPATVHRRLGRLRRLGIVEQRTAKHDRRILHLTLSPIARKLHARWARQFIKDAGK
jgi:DNA-binding MarR family transcriptional regulator